MKTRTINLGYIAMEGYRSGHSLWSKWMREDYKHAGEIAKHPADEIVLPAGEYRLVIDYPLNNEFTHNFTVPRFRRDRCNPNYVVAGGFARRELVNLIVKSYKKIYRQEDRAATEVTIGKHGPLFNRDQSDGPYGIWGHCLGDLILHTAYVNEAGKITLGVDS